MNNYNNYNDFKINLFNAHVEENKIKFKIDNKIANLPNIEYQGSVYVSFRHIMELFDIDFVWNEEMDEVKILE